MFRWRSEQGVAVGVLHVNPLRGDVRAAPVRFSTVTDWPDSCCNWLAMMRAERSTPPPAATETTIRTGCSGSRSGRAAAGCRQREDQSCNSEREADPGHDALLELGKSPGGISAAADGRDQAALLAP